MSFFEDPHFQDNMERARQNTADRFRGFVAGILSATTNSVQGLSLIVLLVTIDLLIVFFWGPRCHSLLVVPVEIIKIMLSYRIFQDDQTPLGQLLCDTPYKPRISSRSEAAWSGTVVY